jgi:hypothetical protein
LEVHLTNTSQKRKNIKRKKQMARNTHAKDCCLLDTPPSIMKVAGFSETSVTPPRPNSVTYQTTGNFTVRAVGSSTLSTTYTVYNERDTY